eukprot:2889559-Rhodomonas_salina.2
MRLPGGGRGRGGGAEKVHCWRQPEGMHPEITAKPPKSQQKQPKSQQKQPTSRCTAWANSSGH